MVPKAEDDALLDKFVTVLKRTTAVFDGIEEGSEEYEQRLSEARYRLDAQLKNKRYSAPVAAPAETESRSVEPPKPEVTEEVRKQANELKLHGNTFLKAKEFDRAVEYYTQCIALDGTNAIYYANLAAAKMHLKELSSAVDDCKVAVSIDSGYVRAHERLANAYRALGMDDLELESLETAVHQHPDNEQLNKMLTDATDRRSATTTDGVPGAGFTSMDSNGQMPSSEHIASMAQGMGTPNLTLDTIQQFLASPDGVHMLSAIRDYNPALESMMQKGLQAITSNPALIDEAMRSMMGGQTGDNAENGNDMNAL